MSWCRPSVVRLAQVMAFKALEAQTKLISFLILSFKHAVVIFFHSCEGYVIFGIFTWQNSELECHRYETEKAVIRAGNILVITDFLSVKVTEEE